MGDRSTVFIRNDDEGVGICWKWLGRCAVDVAVEAALAMTADTPAARAGEALVLCMTKIRGGKVWTHAHPFSGGDWPHVIIDTVRPSVHVSGDLWSEPGRYALRLFSDAKKSSPSLDAGDSLTAYCHQVMGEPARERAAVSRGLITWDELESTKERA